ncbi:hypothetical protein GYMLUDRAFT_759479 [Collybiopsis luxurians FD-317 M1]|uniref:Uncharacterized protein n=1 Tax=Collybiopsis luxurians FD-317 M1 TaxID=944289 RepID=A0A0D0C4V8_9AGAR|nr:hypothetical protein GYMLUDRAFT_759479 [Collybiopsis luxurians FD-317 M1]
MLCRDVFLLHYSSFAFLSTRIRRLLFFFTLVDILLRRCCASRAYSLTRYDFVCLVWLAMGMKSKFHSYLVVKQAFPKVDAIARSKRTIASLTLLGNLNFVMLVESVLFVEGFSEILDCTAGPSFCNGVTMTKLTRPIMETDLDTTARS